MQSLFKTISFAFLLAMGVQTQTDAQVLSPKPTKLTEWSFSKDGQSWEQVTVPHSCNAQDGHSSAYYRGKVTYKKTFDFSKSDLDHPSFLLFEGAAQAAQISINGKPVLEHKGGYTPFVVPLQGRIQKGENVVTVTCDNHEDVDLIPVSSDFNKNNGLHNPAYLLRMNDIYLSPQAFGLYRMHVSTPSVTAEQGQTKVETVIKNASGKKQKIQIRVVLKDAQGIVRYQHELNDFVMQKGDSTYFQCDFTLQKPHLWSGRQDPYLYTASIIISDKKGKELDHATTKVGYRFYEMTRDKGFFLNGNHYPLRGVAVHQDWNDRASALQKEDYDQDYQIIHEIGANFLRLAHYPHNDYAFHLCDSLGIIVQTEIPWVNVCGVNGKQIYFDNIHQQMKEMISNLYNHPAIVFWGMWNELDRWGNTDKLQGKMDAKRVVSETNKLYDYAKTLDPYRYVGLTDCSRFRNEGYTSIRADYYSENRYNGWYYKVGEMETFTKEMNEIHQKMGICNVAEYGAGTNPYCHTVDTTLMKNRKDDTRHYEEYGNWVHESHAQQIKNMPFLNFTSAWVMFDFAVANRQEGFMNSDDGVHFQEDEFRKYTNDKGLVTRDRKIKKDVFYLYKSLWNQDETTVHMTSHRLHYYPAERPIYIKVYSNAPSLTLYQNGAKVETKTNSGENTGVVWTFGPLSFKGQKDTFKVVAPDGTNDELTWEKMVKQ